jgi:ribonuclease P protein component
VSAVQQPDRGGPDPASPGKPEHPRRRDEAGGTKRFPREARLLKHAAFEAVYRYGRRIFSGSLTVFFLRRDDAGPSRVGFTVSRALGGAVERNRIKRRMREAVRHRRALLSGPVDVVINPKRTVLQLEFERLLNEVERAFAGIQQRLAAPSRGNRPKA